jgi:hypothetical protein
VQRRTYSMQSPQQKRRRWGWMGLGLRRQRAVVCPLCVLYPPLPGGPWWRHRWEAMAHTLQVKTVDVSPSLHANSDSPALLFLSNRWLGIQVQDPISLTHTTLITGLVLTPFSPSYAIQRHLRTRASIARRSGGMAPRATPAVACVWCGLDRVRDCTVFVRGQSAACTACLACAGHNAFVDQVCTNCMHVHACSDVSTSAGISDSLTSLLPPIPFTPPPTPFVAACLFVTDAASAAGNLSKTCAGLSKTHQVRSPGFRRLPWDNHNH